MNAAAQLCTAWFGPQRLVIGPLAAAGFSGSRVYRVEVAADAHDGAAAGPGAGGRFILKSFHAQASREQAAWVHGLMRRLRAEGIGEVPALVPCLRDGLPDCPTLQADATGTLWEMAQWLPGGAVEAPSVAQATAALEALARLHTAAARLPGPPQTGPSPGQLRRRQQARDLLERPWSLRRTACGSGVDAALVARFDEAIAIFARADGDRAVASVARLVPRPLPLQPVLRDVWSDHVLFTVDEHGASATGNRVSAIIDYHAAGVDTPATDLARLLGSWLPPVAGQAAPLLDAWREPLAAYERLRPLAAVERRLVPWLDATAVILGLDNWFRWTLDEQRKFPDTTRVQGRIDRLLRRLEGAIEQALHATADFD